MRISWSWVLVFSWTVYFLILAGGVLSTTGLAQEIVPATDGTEVTIQGNMVCNGACIPDPKPDDHVMVVYAIDGTADIRAAVAMRPKSC